MIRDHTDPLPMDHRCDAVVVGAGPGGAAVARQLALAGWSVVVVEEGPPTSRFRPSFAHASRYHYQEDGQMIAMGSSPLPVMAGRGVGGGSLINGGIVFRTPDHVLERWARDLHDERLQPANLGPVFDEIEQLIEVSPPPPGMEGEHNRIVVRGVKALGLEGGYIQRNAPRCVGCGICNVGCPVGGKASVDLNLIAEARQHGCVVQADAHVERLLLQGDRAEGVAGTLLDTDTRQPFGTFRIRAKVVVLAAGAIGTPRLLWADGLARRLGPVGEQLHLHPGTAVLAWREEPVHWTFGAMQGAWAHDPEHPHVLPHTFNVPPDVLVSQSGKVGRAAKEVLMDFQHYCGLGVMVSDKGHGSVRARRDGTAKLSYSWDDHDLDVLKAGMVLSARILFAGGVERVTATAYGLGWYRDADSLQRALQHVDAPAFTTYSAHPMSTCQMGTDLGGSVVNRRGRAHRLPGLYIADASVFPSSLGVNPQLTTMALATLVGRSIVEDEG